MGKENKTGTIWNKMYICAFMANILLCLSQNIVNTLVSTYAQLLGAGTVLVGMISGLYFAVSFAARPFSGPAITRLNKKKIMFFAYGLGVIVNLMYALAGNVGWFVVARVLHGLQFAFIGSLNMTLAADALPPEKMGSGLGIFGVGGAMAMAIGPTVGIEIRDAIGALYGEVAGYSAVFMVSALCMLISIIPCILMPYKPNTAAQTKSLGKWYSNIIAKEAIIPSIVLIVFTVAGNTYTTYMVPFAAEKGIDRISLFFTVYAVGLFLSRFFGGKLIDKYGTKAVFYPSMISMAISLVLVGSAKSLWLCLAAAVFAALGYGTGQPALQAVVMQSVPKLRSGIASNTAYFGMDLGFFLGPMLGGLWTKVFGTYSAMFYCAVGVLAIGTLFFGLTWKPYNEWLQKKKAAWPKEEIS